MAGQFAFPDFSELTTDDLELALYLKREVHVLTITGTIWGYQGRGHLRIALANPLEVQEEGLARMDKALRKFHK
jgi:aspartate/methionine/tyrosine aminotransferase